MKDDKILKSIVALMIYLCRLTNEFKLLWSNEISVRWCTGWIFLQSLLFVLHEQKDRTVLNHENNALSIVWAYESIFLCNV